MEDVKKLNNDINKELKNAAVYERNLEKVKALLSAGANANEVEWPEYNTLLHRTSSVEITKELLLHGAQVNATNTYYETPLHSAVTEGKGSELVRELLKHGANVNTTTRKGNTALNLAIKKSFIDMGVVKELLKYGADINITNRGCFNWNNLPHSSLDTAVGKDEECAKLLIKFTLIRNFDKDYRKIINLSPYKEYSNYSKLSSYLEDCVCEIIQMKTDKIKDNLPLYECVKNNSNIHVLYYQLSVKLAKIDYSIRYPIYNDIILDQLKPFFERTDLLNKLSTIQFYTKLDTSTQDFEGKKIILNYDSVFNIIEYLSNDDLLNFIAAFDDSNKCTIQSSSSLNNLEEPGTSNNETSTSNDTKRARLE